MILIDASIWVDHLRSYVPRLATLLDAREVLCHPFVIGELALGNLPQRPVTLRLLAELPAAPTATDEEVLGLIERERLFGVGIGYVDAHLLASTMLGAGTRLWSRDSRLHAVAERFGLASS